MSADFSGTYGRCWVRGEDSQGREGAELPVAQATKLELVVNPKTVKAIGVELPTSILLRADEVIE